MLQISKIFFGASLIRYVGMILAASFLILSVNPANAQDANQTGEDSTQNMQNR
jgi:hypothetical protein